MQRRSLIIFIVLNVIISLGVAFGVISLWNAQNPSGSRVEVITVEVRITNTPDPNATIPVRIITSTPLPGSIGVLPTGVLDATPEQSLTPAPTQDAAILSGALSENTPLQGTATALPEGCILHVIQSGDTPFGVAQQYGADFFETMNVNGLTEDTATGLQIGDVLIVPQEGCPLTAADVAAVEVETEEATPEVTPEATAEATAETLPTLRPTLTLPPTAANAQVEIVEVIGAGDVTREEIVIRNNGANVNLQGWTLSDEGDNVYTFAERFIFSQASIRIATRVGEDTASIVFWNRNAPLFGTPGAVLTLRDRNGTVQSTFRVPAPVSLP
ncbi:MAG: lamin tail domain-containing protein [Chloroflexi bacterium]|nr:lamin tail domain-containing protein [Chloroflexota bacterium]